MDNLEGIEYALENSTTQKSGISAGISYSTDNSALLTISDLNDEQYVEIDLSIENNSLFISDNGFVETDDNMTDEELIGTITRKQIVTVVNEYVHNIELLTYEETDMLLHHLTRTLVGEEN